MKLDMADDSCVTLGIGRHYDKGAAIVVKVGAVKVRGPKPWIG
jgi:hypothetical protein